MVSVYQRSGCIPNVFNEGVFLKPVPVEGDPRKGKCWHQGLNTWQRLGSHHTYSSVRRTVPFKPYRVYRDNLDFALASSYLHNEDSFPARVDFVMQEDTMDWYLKFLHEKAVAKAIWRSTQEKYQNKAMVAAKSKKMYSDRSVCIGGIKQKGHPCSVKLMNSSHHSPQTNAGYVRQDRDGNLFQY